MEQLTDVEKKTLLELARRVIASKFSRGKKVGPPESLSPALTQFRGCFVTLHKKRSLRGCIGTIEPTAPLIEGIEDNAVNAAFGDPRFPPLGEEELAEIEIEISVLTPPEKLIYTDAGDLLARLKPGVHGVILSKKGGHRSTFLPQVWQQLPEKERFLEQLCLKGAMGKECWKEGTVQVQVYEVECFSEASP